MFFFFLFFLLLLNAVVFRANAMDGQLTPKTVVTRMNQSEAIQPSLSEPLEVCQVGASKDSHINAFERSSVLKFQQLPLDILNYVALFLCQRTLVKLSKTNKFFYGLIDSAKIYGAFKKAAISGKWYLPMESYNGQQVDHEISLGDFYAVVSQSNIGLLEIFFCPQLEFSSVIPCASAICIAAHNGFEEGVKFLTEYSHLTLKQCQELIPTLIFPLTSDLLLAAIYYADTDEFKSILFSQQFFICANNEYVLAKALVDAVYLKKVEHIKCLQEYPFTKYALGSQELQVFFTAGLTYSMEKFGDISFMNFLESQSLNKEAIFFESVVDFLFEKEYDLLLRRFAVFSECFKTFFITSSNLKLGSKWKLSPEALYYISLNCNISVFHVTKLCCLEAFVSKGYSQRDSTCLLSVGLVALPDFPMCEEDDSFFVVFYKSNYKSLGALGIKESLSYFSKIHIPIHVRHSLLEFFRGLPDSDDQKLYSIFVNRWKTFKEREN